MRKRNIDVRNTRFRRFRHFRMFLLLLLSILILAAGTALAGQLYIEGPESIPFDKRTPTIITGVPFSLEFTTRSTKFDGLTAGPGKIAMIYPKLKTVENDVKLIDAKVDDPSIVEIVRRGGSSVLLKGKATGETRLRVKTRGAMGKTETTTTIKTAVPNAVRLTPFCGDERVKGMTPLMVPVGADLMLTEELYYNSTPVMTDNFPEVDLGGLTLSPTQKPDPVDGRLHSGRRFYLKAPATATKTSLKIPANGYELPVTVYDSSGVTEVHLEQDGKAYAAGWSAARVHIRMSPEGGISCFNPIFPIDITVGPVKVCELSIPPGEKKTVDSGNQVAEMRVPHTLVIRGITAGACTVTVSVKGSGRSATEQITIYENNAKQP